MAAEMRGAAQSQTRSAAVRTGSTTVRAPRSAACTTVLERQPLEADSGVPASEAKSRFSVGVSGSCSRLCWSGDVTGTHASGWLTSLHHGKYADGYLEYTKAVACCSSAT